MRVGNFSLIVPEGVERESGHVAIRDSQQYTLRLINHCYDARCDVLVTIDGKDMGLYRINAGQQMILERSSLDNGRFTFFSAKSAAGQQVGAAGVAVDLRGLIFATFKPERRRERHVKTSVLRTHSVGMTQPDFGEKHHLGECDMPRGMSHVDSRLGAGVTGLTGHSDQQFTTVSALDYDPAGETTINLRLGVDEFNPRPMTGRTQSNPVPAPVE